VDECLSSYIEFKRVSLGIIFDQLGSQEQEQENLETQSSLDNDEEHPLSAHKPSSADGGGGVGTDLLSAPHTSS